MSDKKLKLWDFFGIFLYVLPDVLKPTFIRDWLHSLFKKTIIKSIVKLFISVLSVYLAVFKPVGELESLWMSSLLFIAVLLWSIVEPIANYYMLLIKIVQERSVRVGIVEFVKWKFSKVSGVYEKVRSYGRRFSTLFWNLRSFDDIIWDCVRYLIKDIIAFVSIFSLYVLLVHWMFKPIILEKFAGLTTMQIYLFPIRQFLW